MPAVTVTLDQRSYSAAMRTLARYEGSPLQRRARAAYLAGARMLVAPMRREAPQGPTGNLRRSIAARVPRRVLPGEMAAASVGPKGGRGAGAHRWLVVAGTRPHSLAARRRGPWVVIPDRPGHVYPGASVQHPGARGNPFVDRVTDRYGGEVLSFIERAVLSVGEVGVVGRFG